MSSVRDCRNQALSKLANAHALIDVGARIEEGGRPIWSILRPDILWLLDRAEELAADDSEVLARATRARNRLASADPPSSSYGAIEVWAA